ncbi:tyrosine-type recombinase/integrase [Paracoccaceae bacterium]|nr:tyrosine-type recombinase/integrase [Paracoccaceae bacterium]
MAKRVPPLSAATLTKFKPDPVKVLELVNGAVPGLRVRITPAGTRSWSLNIRAQGKMRRFDVGQGLGLSDARLKAEDLRRRIKEGADPTAEKRTSRHRTHLASQGIGTFGAMVETYFRTGQGAGLSTKDDQLRRIRSVFAAHLNRSAVEVRSSELQLSIDKHGAKVSAARAAGYLTPILQWAKRRDLVVGDFNLEKPVQDAPRQKVLTEVELAALLPTFKGHHGVCAKFMLLTGARITETTAATWSQINLETKTWTIPPENRKDTRALQTRRHKPKLALVIPLSRQAIDQLLEARRAEVARRQLNGLTKEIRQKDLLFVGPRGAKLGNWDRWLKGTTVKTGIAGWSAHALRRTTATLAGDLGAPPHVVSVVLGHSNVGGQLVAGYNHSTYCPEHRQILQEVAVRLDTIEGL